MISSGEHDQTQKMFPLSSRAPSTAGLTPLRPFNEPKDKVGFVSSQASTKSSLAVLSSSSSVLSTIGSVYGGSSETAALVSPHNPWSRNKDSTQEDGNLESGQRVKRCRNQSKLAWRTKAPGWLSAWKHHDRPRSRVFGCKIPRWESACTLGTLDWEKRSAGAAPSEVAGIWPAAPINCTFLFDEEAYYHGLDYFVFRQWHLFSSLLGAVQSDVGLLDVQIWDMDEQIEVMAGDWEARVRPGWDIVVHGAYVGEQDDGKSEQDGAQELWGAEKEGGQWWFQRWRERAEGGTAGGRRQRGWLVGLVGLVGTVGGSWLVISLAGRR